MNPPWDVNAIVEVPLGAHPVKYEMDKDSGAIFVDRFLHTSMQYPLNYGFIPHTLANDGDPVDVLIANNIPVIPGAVVRVRPIGMLVMEDEAGEDEKVLSVPVAALHPSYSNVSSYRSEEHPSDLQSLLRIPYAVLYWPKTHSPTTHSN